MHLVILAAGMGSRYGGLKQLDAVGPNGETLLDYSVFDAVRAGYRKVVFVIRRDIEAAFRNHIGSRYEDQLEIAYAFQELDDLPDGRRPVPGRTKPWGTAHAVWTAREELTGPFTVINADDFYGREAYAIMAGHARQEQNPERLLSLVAYPLVRTLSPHGTVNRGICEVEEDRLISVREATEIAFDASGKLRGKIDGNSHSFSPDAPVSMNFWGFSDVHLPLLQSYLCDFLTKEGASLKAESYIPGFVDHLIQTKGALCRVLSSTASWFGVTFPEDKVQVQAGIEKEIREGRYPSRIK